MRHHDSPPPHSPSPRRSAAPSTTSHSRAREGACAATGKPSDLDDTRFRATVECAPVGIAHVRPDGRWLWVNDAFCGIVGYSREELLVRSFQDITHPDDLTADLAYIEQMLAGTINTYALDKRYFRRDGSAVWIHLTASLVRDDEGQPAYFIAVTENITERKRLEDEQSQILNIVGHEISTPLTSLKARTQLLRRHMRKGAVTPEMLTQQLAAIERATKQLEQQAQDLRTAAHMEQGGLTIHPTPCDLVALAEQVVDAQRVVEHTREIRFEAPDAPITIFADGDRLAQVLGNLLTNALKYSPADRPVTVSVRREADHAVITVCDQGPGIPTEALPHLFQRFYRVPGIGSAQTGKSSLGLGLYIARTIVERHGGTLTVRSTPGAGATFKVALPLAGEGEPEGV